MKMAFNQSQMAGPFDTDSMINLRVLAASTGVCYNVTLHPNELSVSSIRSRLATALPIDDQILLLGPPYKVPKDSLLRTNETISALRLGDEEDDYFRKAYDSSVNKEKLSILAPTEKTGSKRLFLFSKRALSEGAPDPPPCILDPSPGPLPMPTQADLPPPPSSAPDTKPTPLRMALDVYERQFMLDMAKGRAYANGAELRLAACRKCIAEQAVIAQALRAAVSNLADHRAGAARERTMFSEEYTRAAIAHQNLLDKFDSRLVWKGGSCDAESTGAISSMIISGTTGRNESLASISLHPSLVSAARSAGRVMESLLDAVPIDQEKAWAGKCRAAHEALSTNFQELDSAFVSALGTTASWNEIAQHDLSSEEAIKALFAEVENVGIRIRNSQSERLDILISNHTEAVRIVSSAVNNESNESQQGAGANSAFSELEQMTQSATSIIPSMEADDNILSELSQRVADGKTNAMQRMKSRLRQISIAQIAIGRANKSVGVLRSALSQQNSDIEHLECVVELPKAYNDFLIEIHRRRAYCIAFRSNASSLLARLDSMRADEVKLRERFLKGPGRYLMPAFYDIFAPTLATSPPSFSPPLPDMAELETLPDVGDEVFGIGVASLDSQNTDGRDDERAASSTSTITECPSIQHPMPPSKEQSAMEISKGLSTDNPSLIVSAVDASGNDVIMQTVCQEGTPTHKNQDNADCSTLMYENAVLRQALERAGCKPPRSYIDIETTAKMEQKAKEQASKTSAIASELAALKLELQKAKSEADELRKAQPAALQQRQCDKISHTSFQVGDVGLFMPTGRGREGKRIYLAFHSGCPHRYLSPDCINGTPDFVLGRIVFQEEFVAGALDTDANPFGLQAGTKYWILSAETLKRG